MSGPDRGSGKARAEISICGQELNDTTWLLAGMNLAIRWIGAEIGKNLAMLGYPAEEDGPP